MKTYNKTFGRILLAVIAVVSALSLQSCKVDEPDKYESTGGVPTIYYIRPADISKKDSLLVSAYPEMTIAIIGENLRSIKEMYFNDLAAVLNSSYITDNALIVTVPKGIPTAVNDKITMITSDGLTTYYDFQVVLPSSTVSSISNEYAQAGETVTIYGDYFLTYDDYPLSIMMPGNIPVTEITNVTKTSVTFVIPNGVTESGNINITTKYGTSKSKFYYRDDRGMIIDWDGIKGLAQANGWRTAAALKVDDGTGVDGAFVRFKGNLTADGWSTSEDDWAFNYWGDGTATGVAISNMPGCDELISKYAYTDMALKFEYRIPKDKPWQSTGLQAIFTKNGVSGTNSYCWDAGLPRAIWAPYATSGSHDTNGEWTTAVIPFTSFNKTHNGEICVNSFSYDYLGGLTFYFMGGPEGVAGTLQIDVDNIRISPIQ